MSTRGDLVRRKLAERAANPHHAKRDDESDAEYAARVRHARTAPRSAGGKVAVAPCGCTGEVLFGSGQTAYVKCLQGCDATGKAVDPLDVVMGMEEPPRYTLRNVGAIGYTPPLKAAGQVIGTFTVPPNWTAPVAVAPAPHTCQCSKTIYIVGARGHLVAEREACHCGLSRLILTAGSGGTWPWQSSKHAHSVTVSVDGAELCGCGSWLSNGQWA